MREHRAHVKRLRVEMNRRDHTETIASDIEYMVFPDLVHRIEYSFQFREPCELIALDQSAPALQGTLSRPMPGREFTQYPVADQTHTVILSRFEIGHNGLR